MAKNKLTRILTSEDKEVNKTFGSNGVLSRLFRKMLGDLNIGPSKFSSLLQEYILDARNKVPANKKDQTSMRGNLTKEFARPQMTWKVFCKAMRFLQIGKIEFVIKAHHAKTKGKTSLHSTVVDFGGPIEADDAFEEAIQQAEYAIKQVETPGTVPVVQYGIKAEHGHIRRARASLHSDTVVGDDPPPHYNENDKPFDNTFHEVDYLDNPLPPLSTTIRTSQHEHRT